MLTYNDYTNTVETLNGLMKQTKSEITDIYIIDNASEEQYREKVSSYAKKNKIQYIYRNINDGYTGGNNYAWNMLKDRYEYIIIVNNDILIYSSALTSTILDVFHSDNRIGIVGPLVKYGEGETVKTNRVLKAVFSKRINCHRFKSTTNYEECESVIGCFLAIKTKNVSFGKLFDESFFMYGEELDLCFRVWNSGYKVVHLKKSTEEIYHKGGNNPYTGSIKDLWKYYLVERNLILCSRNLYGITRIKYLGVLLISYIYRCYFGKLGYLQRKAVKDGFRKGFYLINNKVENTEILDDATSYLEMVNKKYEEQKFNNY